jgi:hypothetical protein
VSARSIAVLVFALWLLSACRLDHSSQSGGDDASTADVALDSPVAAGQTAIQARRCGRCHQDVDPAAGVLSGQSVPVPGTQAYGSNLTPDPETGLDAWDAGTLAASILHAWSEDGGPLCPSMPAYVDAGMSASEAAEIAAYLQTLTAVWHQVPMSSCPPITQEGDGG